MKNAQFPAGVKPSIQATITEESGKKIQLSNKDFLANSLCFKNGTTDQGSFTVGGGIIGSVSFSLINEGNLASAINYVNATVEISLTAGGQTVDMGKYWFIDHTGNNNLVKCDAYDALQIFDEHQLYESSITYPTTAKSLAQKLVTARGFKITGLPTVDVPINNPRNDDMTERECLRYLAQLLGMYVVAKGDTIVFGTYSRTTKHDAGTSFSHNLRTEAITITDVVVNANKQQAQPTAGTGGYVVTVDNNPFINEQNTALVQANLNKNIRGLSFHPGTYNIKANPAIEAGDCLLVRTRDAQYTAYVTNISYKIQLQQAIKSDADNYIGDRRISKKPKTFIEIVKNTTQSQISNDLKNPNSELSQAIGQGGSGSGGLSLCIANDSFVIYQAELLKVFTDNHYVKLCYKGATSPARTFIGSQVAAIIKRIVVAELSEQLPARSNFILKEKTWTTAVLHDVMLETTIKDENDMDMKFFGDLRLSMRKEGVTADVIIEQFIAIDEQCKGQTCILTARVQAGHPFSPIRKWIAVETPT